MSGRYPVEAVRLPVNAQRWSELTFAHWRYPAEMVQPLVPHGLEVQVINGSAWVGLVPLRMGGVRTPPLPPVPRWSDFAELNVRTYVRGPDGRDGLWFFSLACPRRAFVVAMRAVGLHYVLADSSVVDLPGGARYRFGSRNRSSGAAWRFDAEVTVGAPLGEHERTPLVDSLTGRWGTYTWVAGQLLRVPVHHQPWPLHVAGLRGDLPGPLTAVGLPAPEGEPLVHYSPGVDTRIGLPAPVR